MMGNEDAKHDPSVVVERSLRDKIFRKQIANDYEIFEVDINNQVKRQVKLDKNKSIFIVYTYQSGLVVPQEKRDKAMLFAAYVNEQLSVTGLDFLIDKGEFRYKSSQSYPKGVDFEPLLGYFYEQHEKHFADLIECIKWELLGSEKEAAMCARTFLDKI